MVLSSSAMRNPLLLGLLTLAALGLVLLRGREPRDPAAGRAAVEAAARRALLQAGRAVVIKAVADLKLRPEEDAPLADQALLGHTVTLVPPQAEGPFVQVETVERYRGYARVTDLVALPPGAPPYGEPGPAAVVRSRFANVFAEPDVTRRNPLVTAPLGVRLQLHGEVDGRWLAVLLPDGRRAFVQRGDVDVGDAPRLTAGCVLDQALRHEGTPYLWGGRSTYGIDCSGLTANSYRACGVLIPRDAGPQHDWGILKRVAPGEARPGDLLFFGSGGGAAGEEPKVTHVGLYLGQDEFVHATTSERPTVHRSRLSDEAWQKILVGIRRHPELKD